MRKFLSLFLALLMVTAIIAMIPAFAVSAAVDTSGLTQNTSSDPLKNGRYEIPANFSGGTGCGFIDGNASPTDSTNYSISNLLGVNGNNNVMPLTKVFVGGVEARFNYSYLGYTHCGQNANGGYFYGVVGAGLKSGISTELVIQIGDEFYMTGMITPSVTTYAVESSSTTYYEGDKTLFSEITFAEDHALNVNDALTLRFHDDHAERSATVTAVNGRTVSIKAENIITSKSLCEFKTSNGIWFTLPIDSKDYSQSAYGYVQLRDNADATKKDTRIIVEALEGFATSNTKTEIAVTFTLADGTTKSTKVTSTNVYKTITANGEVYNAHTGYALMGYAVTGVPMNVQSVSAAVTFLDENNGISTVIDLGSACLTNSKANLSDIKRLDRYDHNLITVTATTGGRGLDEGEGVKKLFDGTVQKHGDHGNFTVTFETYSPIVVTGLIFTIANDSAAYGRYYTTWELKGSTDGQNWYTVTSSNTPVSKGDRTYNNSDYASLEEVPDGLREAYKIYNVEEYKYYQFSATPNPDQQYNQMGEITLYTGTDYTVDYVKTNMTKYTGGITINSTSNDQSTTTTDGECLTKLFDGTSKKHGTGYADFNITFTTAEAISISGIIFTHGNDSSSSDRYYTKWKLEGSTDGGNTWVTIANSGLQRPTVNFNDNNTPNPDDVPDGAREAFIVKGAAEYSFYKLTVTGKGNNYNQMGEITFYTAQ